MEKQDSPNSSPKKILAAFLILIGVAVLGYTIVYANGDGIQGFMSRRGQSQDSSSDSRMGTRTAQTSSIPWWCIDECENGHYEVDEVGNMICIPDETSTETSSTEPVLDKGSKGIKLTGDSSTTTDRTPGLIHIPSKNEDSKDGPDDSDRKPIPGTNTNTSIDPENGIIYGLSPQVMEAITPSEMELILHFPGAIPPAIIDTINGNTGGPGGVKLPPVEVPIDDRDLPPETGDAYHECSCDATDFTMDGFGDIEFNCPPQGMEITYEKTFFEWWIGTDEYGDKTVTAYTPISDQCQPELNDNEIVRISQVCDCNQEYAYIYDVDQEFRCPEPMEDSYHDLGQYKVHIWSIPKYMCDESMACPEGTEYNWEKLRDDCREAKKDMCNDEEVDPEIANICDAFVPDIWNRDCPEDGCEETEALHDAGVSHQEITAQGYPHPYDCFLY